MSSPRTGISCRIACRWRARRATRASRFMSQRAWSTARPRSRRKALCSIRCRSCAAGCRRSAPSPRSARCVASIARSRPPSRIMSHCRPRCLDRSPRWDGRCSCVNALTGLGYTFISDSAKAIAAASGHRHAAPPAAQPSKADRRWCKIPTTATACSRSASRADRIVLIPGSGVDVEALQPLPEPPGPPTIAFVGRLLDDKGIRTLIARPPAAAPARLERRAADRGNARPGQSGLGERAAKPRAGAASPASPGSVTSTTSRRSGRAPISRCCRRGARACRKACWRPRPAAGR